MACPPPNAAVWPPGLLISVGLGLQWLGAGFASPPEPVVGQCRDSAESERHISRTRGQIWPVGCAEMSFLIEMESGETSKVSVGRKKSARVDTWVGSEMVMPSCWFGSHLWGLSSGFPFTSHLVPLRPCLVHLRTSSCVHKHLSARTDSSEEAYGWLPSLTMGWHSLPFDLQGASLPLCSWGVLLNYATTTWSFYLLSGQGPASSILLLSFCPQGRNCSAWGHLSPASLPQMLISSQSLLGTWLPPLSSKDLL